MLPQYRSEGGETVNTLSDLNASNPSKFKFEKVLITEEKVPLGKIELPFSIGGIKAIIYDDSGTAVL
jgi:hypothetical protein